MAHSMHTALPELPNVIAAGVIDDLTSRASGNGDGVSAVVLDAQATWFLLGEVFHVKGTSGVPYMLNPIVANASDYRSALNASYRVGTEAEDFHFGPLRTRRQDLADRISAFAGVDALNVVGAECEGAYSNMKALPPNSPERAQAGDVFSQASNEYESLRAEYVAIKQEIAAFRKSLEDGEEAFASGLTGISGGTEVFSANGIEVNVSTGYWGERGNNRNLPPSTWEDALVAHLSTAVAERIEKLSAMDPAAAEAWVASHPDFPSAVGFVSPEEASSLFNSLAAESTKDENGNWISGPLAALLAVAPFAIGNLNGVPVTEHDEFGNAYLDQLISRTTDPTTLSQLESLKEITGLTPYSYSHSSSMRTALSKHRSPSATPIRPITQPPSPMELKRIPVNFRSGSQAPRI